MAPTSAADSATSSKELGLGPEVRRLPHGRDGNTLRGARRPRHAWRAHLCCDGLVHAVTRDGELAADSHVADIEILGDLRRGLTGRVAAYDVVSGTTSTPRMILGQLQALHLELATDKSPLVDVGVML